MCEQNPIFIFVVVNFDALTQASDIRVERRPVAFLCWMQNSNSGSLEPNLQQTECPIFIMKWTLCRISLRNTKGSDDVYISINILNNRHMQVSVWMSQFVWMTMRGMVVRWGLGKSSYHPDMISQYVKPPRFCYASLKVNTLCLLICLCVMQQVTPIGPKIDTIKYPNLLFLESAVHRFRFSASEPVYCWF